MRRAEPGSWCIEGVVIPTAPAYSGLAKEGYVHRSRSAAQAVRVGIDASSLLKRWLLGTHQGAVSHKHLDYYLDEFTFRFTAANPKAEANSSIGSSSRRWPWIPRLTR